MTYQIIARCAKELKKTQLDKLPADVKEVVMSKWEKIEEKKRV